MPNASLTTNSSSQHLLLKGDLTLQNVTTLWHESKILFDRAQSPVHLELKDVTQSDSAGIALLIAWVRTLRQQKKEIYLKNPSPQMQAIAEISGLTHLLPFIE